MFIPDLMAPINGGEGRMLIRWGRRDARLPPVAGVDVSMVALRGMWQAFIPPKPKQREIP